MTVTFRPTTPTAFDWFASWRESIPLAPKCTEDGCNQLVGAWSKVHFARVTDAKPCPGSWPTVKKQPTKEK